MDFYRIDDRARYYNMRINLDQLSPDGDENFPYSEYEIRKMSLQSEGTESNFSEARTISPTDWRQSIDSEASKSYTSESGTVTPDNGSTNTSDGWDSTNVRETRC